MAMPRVGDTAPDFEATTDTGESIKLSALRGKTVVLYFYPKADTPTCTKEACSFRDSYAAFRDRHVVLLGVSPNSEADQAAFSSKYNLPFPLLADADRAISSAYGVYGTRTVKREDGSEVEYTGVHRITFLIDEQGKVKRVFDPVNVATHTEEVLAAL